MKRQAPRLALFALVFATLGLGLRGDFISDDWPLIAENPKLASVDSVSDYFTRGVWWNSAFERADAQLYRPLYLLYYWAIHRVAGPSPFAYHLVLLIIHGVNAVLLLLLLERLFPRTRPWGPWLGAAVFAIHPAQTQAVGWISGGTDVVAGFFVLAAVHFYLARRDGGRCVWLAASLAAFAAATLTKETGVALVLVPAVLDLHSGHRWRDLLHWRHAAFCGVAAAYVVVRSLIVDSPALAFTAAGCARLAEQVCVSLRYTVFPWPLPFYFRYPVDGVASALDWTVGACALAGLALLAIASRPARIGVAWAALALAPTLSLAFHEGGVFALRFLYLPLMGVGVAVCVFASAVVRRRRGAMVAVPILAACALASMVGIGDWRNEGVFFEKLREQSPKERWGYEGLGRQHARQGDHASAVAVYRLGVERVLRVEDRFQLAKLLARQHVAENEFLEAEEVYGQMLRLIPGAEAWVGIGNCRWRRADLAAALDAYRQAVSFDPEDSLALANLAQLSALLGRHDEATAHYERLLSLPLDRVDSRALSRARAYLAQSPARSSGDASTVR